MASRADLYFLRTAKVWDPEKHPRGEGGRFGSGASRKATLESIASGARALSEGKATPEAQAALRESLRDVLRAHGIVPRDETLRGTTSSNRAVAQTPMKLGGLLAAKDKDGLMRLDSEGLQRSLVSLDLLARDAPEPGTQAPDFYPNSALKSLHLMLHEELHGASRLAPEAYKGAGAGMEEVATEILARRLMRDLVGQTLTPESAGKVAFGLPVKSGPGYWNQLNAPDVYPDEIRGLFNAVAKVSGHENIHQRVEEALLRTRQGTGREPAWTHPDDQIHAFVDALGLDAKKRTALVKTLTGKNSPLLITAR